MVDGRRITDKGTLDIVTMVYAGLVNKQLVAGLQRRMQCTPGYRAPTATPSWPPRTRNRSTTASWATSKVSTTRCSGELLGAGVTPVFCAIMHDGQGTLLNCNADSVASSVALGAARIAPHGAGFSASKKAACCATRRTTTTLIREITAESYAALKAGGIVSKGMIPKVENALKAVANGVRSVTIKHSENLLNDTGTVIR